MPSNPVRTLAFNTTYKVRTDLAAPLDLNVQQARLSERSAIFYVTRSDLEPLYSTSVGVCRIRAI